MGSLILRGWNPQFLCHSDQLGQRSRIHFLHHLAAMDLDGDFAGAQFARDLFVEQTRDHPGHDFTLASGQRIKSLAQLGGFRPLLTRAAVAFQRLLNRVEQILIAKGFGEKLHAPAFIARTDIGMSPWPVIKMTAD